MPTEWGDDAAKMVQDDLEALAKLPAYMKDSVGGGVHGNSAHDRQFRVYVTTHWLSIFMESPLLSRHDPKAYAALRAEFLFSDGTGKYPLGVCMRFADLNPWFGARCLGLVPGGVFTTVSGRPLPR